MEKAELTPRDLDRVFTAARSVSALSDPSEKLMGRVMQDALALMPAPAAPAATAPRLAHQTPSAGRFARLWSALSAGFGGGGVVASLGAVAVVAVFLGYTAPAGLAEDLMMQVGPGADDGIEIEPVAIYFLAGG